MWVSVEIPTEILWEWELKFHSHGDPNGDTQFTIIEPRMDHKCKINSFIVHMGFTAAHVFIEFLICHLSESILGILSLEMKMPILHSIEQYLKSSLSHFSDIHVYHS